MATPAGQFRPWRLIGAFVVLTAVLYALVFFTPGSKTPKLGIDLQGGTRITLTAETITGQTPSQESMKQARQIMETRVNGSGVVGAQVQIDGSNQLVVTVPGNQDLSGLTRSAQLNIRPQLASGYDISQLSQTTGSATSGTGTSGTGSGTSAAPTTAPAIGDTEAPGTPSPAARATVAPATSAGSSKVTATRSTAPASSAKSSAPTSAGSAASSGQGLRRVAPTTTAAASTTVPATSAAAPATAAQATTAPATSATATGTAATGTAASGTAATGTASAATWPIPGSDPKNPNQPAGKDAASWTAWTTAATTAVQANQIKCKDLEKTQGQDDPARPLLACGTGSAVDSATVYLLDKTLISGDQVDTAAASLDSSSGAGWVVNISFKTEGYKTWSTYTTNNVGKQTAFVLDGQVLSSPTIQEAITTTATRVTGSFNQASATALANSLKFGALPLHFSQAEAVQVSAELGLEYLQAGLIAGGIGLLLVVVYCLLYYRLLGVITILSLILSFGLIYAIMVLLGRWISLSLDMAGIAGLIVAIGITADSFVIYFERLKDEVREGRTFRSAVPRGWERAKRTILSADAVSFLSALVLYVVAVGNVRGFAFTLGLSTVLDLVVVFLVTHPLVALASGAKIFQSARYSGLGAVAAAGAEQRAATSRFAVKEA